MRSRQERLAALRGLYGIVTDEGPLPPLSWARALAAGGARAVQLRVKRLPPREALSLARALRTELPNVLLIVNDRPDLALLAGADGVHVGEEDLSPADARRVVGPDLLVGATARSAAGALAALRDGADHLGVGPVFPSGTKPLPVAPLGIPGLAEICLAVRPAPVVAISGIDEATAGAVAGAGAACAAVIGAVGGSEDPAAAARAISDAFEGRAPASRASPTVGRRVRTPEERSGACEVPSPQLRWGPTCPLPFQGRGFDTREAQVKDSSPPAGERPGEGATVFGSLIPTRRIQPLVGLSAGYSEHELGRDYRRHELRAAYVDAVVLAGGLPVVLATVDPALADAIVARLDALLLTGGHYDIPPAEYGEAPAPGLGPVAPERTAYERALLAAADRRGLPVLGICGGMQLIVVARGGKLHQHLPADIASDILHEQREDRRRPSHHVRVVAGTRLAGAVGEGEILVNSSHHQGVRILGKRLVPTAQSPDGLVEGVEEAGPRFVVGVQWHPELLVAALPEQRVIFERFVAAAREQRGGRGDG